MTFNNNFDSTDYSEENNEEKRLERNRGAEYGKSYDQFFKPCDNCGKFFEWGSLYYLNTDETVKVCSQCYSKIKYEESIRELRKYR